MENAEDRKNITVRKIGANGAYDYDSEYLNPADCLSFDVRDFYTRFGIFSLFAFGLYFLVSKFV